jgi:ATP-dependent Clp protease, protease subunit
MKSEFKITNKADSREAEVFIYGEIGAEFWGDEISAKTFVDQLAALPESVETIRVRINSPGGSVWDGYTMYSALTSHPAEIITEVDGLAASAASLVAMAGTTRRMGEASMMMIHRASGGVWGDADEMRKEADLLDKVDGQITEVYSRRSGKPVADVAELLADETWFTGPEAVEAGFADEVTEQLATAAQWKPGRFRNAPKQQNELILDNILRGESVISIAQRDANELAAKVARAKL